MSDVGCRIAAVVLVSGAMVCMSTVYAGDELSDRDASGKASVGQHEAGQKGDNQEGGAQVDGGKTNKLSGQRDVKATKTEGGGHEKAQDGKGKEQE